MTVRFSLLRCVRRSHTHTHTSACIDLIGTKWRNRFVWIRARMWKKGTFCHWCVPTTFVSSLFFLHLNRSNLLLRVSCMLCPSRKTNTVDVWMIFVDFVFCLFDSFPVHFNGRRFDVNASVNDHINSSRLEYKYRTNFATNADPTSATATKAIRWTGSGLGRSVKRYSEPKSIQVCLTTSQFAVPGLPLNHTFSSRYVPPPPSRPRYNQNNDIPTNEIGNDNDIDDARYGRKYPTKHNNDGSFFVDVPPKFYKTASPAKQQYYQQQYLNDLLNRNLYSQSNGKYNIIAFKNTYHNVPYYVVST